MLILLIGCKEEVIIPSEVNYFNAMDTSFKITIFKNENSEDIDQFDELLRELLDRRYIRGERFEEIACALRKPKDGKKYTYRHVVMELHPKALKEIENILSAYH